MGTGIALFIDVALPSIRGIRCAVFVLLSTLLLCVSVPTQSFAGRGPNRNRVKKSSVRNHTKKVHRQKRHSRAKTNLQGSSLLRKSKPKVESLLRKIEAPKAAQAAKKKSLKKSTGNRKVERRSTATRRSKSAKRSGPRRSASRRTKKNPIVRVFVRTSAKLVSAWRKFGQWPSIRFLKSRYTLAKISTTRILSGLQSKLPKPLAGVFQKIRKYSLSSVLAFSHHKLKSDKLFMGWYFAVNTAIADIGLPAMVSLGFSSVAATGLYFLATPITLGVLVAREHTLRKRRGEPGTIKETAIAVLREYQSFADKRFTTALRDAEAPVVVGAR